MTACGSVSVAPRPDQEGQGAVVDVAYGSNPPTCPVRAWRSWVQAAAIDGPTFRAPSHRRLTAERLSGDSIARMVKRRANAAGLASVLFSGHSLRSGFATTAARAGVPEHEIMRPGPWTTNQAMRSHIQEGELSWTTPRPNSWPAGVCSGRPVA